MIDAILIQIGGKALVPELSGEIAHVANRLQAHHKPNDLLSTFRAKAISCQSPKLICHVGNGGDMNAAVGSLLLS